MNPRPTLHLATLVALCAAAAPLAAAAPPNLLCALTRALSCDPLMDCATRNLDDLNLPRFVDIDLAGKRLTGQRPDGSTGNTIIERMARTSDTLALQGSEAGRAWSIVIGDSGDATFTSSQEDGATVIFAVCALR
jgi:hypothetical protein